MNTENLWSDLEPLADKLENAKKDYERGITPYLPYFIIGQDNAKEDIGKKIKKIDKSQRLMTSFILGEYGNGKTNLFDYLRLYAKRWHNNLHVIRMDANVDTPDVFTMLLYLLEVEFIDIMIPMFQDINKGDDAFDYYRECAAESNAIKEYINAFANHEKEDEIRELIYLGTGRLYAKADWKKFGGMKQLSNYERRDILVFFLNIISKSKQFIIFEIDELEKIREKSKIRFYRFLTSFRELLDISKRINGHLLIAAMTISKGPENESVLQDNPAFFSRIQKDLITLKPMRDIGELKKLTTVLASLLEVEVTDDRITDIATKASSNYVTQGDSSNRAIVKNVCQLLQSPTEQSVEEFDLERELSAKKLDIVFYLIRNELETSGAFYNIDRKIFAPLSYYLTSKGYSVEGNLRQQEKVLLIPDAEKAIIWNFSKETLPKSLNDCKLQSSKYNRLYLLKADYDLQWENIIPFNSLNVEVIEFSPTVLMTLLVMYNQLPTNARSIDEIIVQYLKGSIL